MRGACKVLCLVGVAVLATAHTVAGQDGKKNGPDTPIVMDFVYVTAGKADFKNPKTSKIYTLDVKGFWIGKHEVTHGSYAVFVNYNNDTKLKPTVKSEDKYIPVTGVSWESADAFAKWCGGGLPSREQWYKAGFWNPKSKTRMPYPWGSSGSVAYHRDKSVPVRVGTFTGDVSFYGALGMAGAPCEWVGKPNNSGYCTAMGYYFRDGRGQQYSKGYANTKCSFRIILGEGAVPKPTKALQQRIDKLISQLGADGFKERRKAQKLLIEFGALARSSLEKALNSKDPEISTRAAAILKIPGPLKLRFVPRLTSRGSRVKIELVTPKVAGEAPKKAKAE